MTSAPPRPALLLALAVPDDFRARLSTRYDVVGPFDARLGDAVAAMPRHEAARIAVIVMYGNTKVTRETGFHPTIEIERTLADLLEEVRRRPSPTLERPAPG